MSNVIREMTADEAMALAKYQRPGVKLIVGQTMAREEWMPALPLHEFVKLPCERET